VADPAPRGEVRRPRIASLVPSLTELLFALGLGEYLVARTGFCIHPIEEVGRVAKVGGTKDVNLAKLRRLAPTHVVLNVDENRRELADTLSAWGGAAPRLVVTHPRTPQDNLTLIDQLRREFGHLPWVNERARAIEAELRGELAATQHAAGATRQVLYLIWREPWMTVARDTYLSAMLQRIHWQTLPAATGGDRGAARYPIVNGTEPWLPQVELVLLSSEPYSFADADAAAAQALCPHAEVCRVDGELLSWYGVRAVEGLRYLRRLADRH
jgi:ABC-type Fe3+-hydroxamate transport system substrate-binding protein